MSKLCRCGKIVKDRCLCNGSQSTQRRSTSTEGHGWDHRQASIRYRAERPLCERCLMLHGVERAQPSEDMHHIHAIKDRPDLRMNRSNWLAVCAPCHEAIEGDAIEGMKIKRWSEENYDVECGVN